MNRKLIVSSVMWAVCFVANFALAIADDSSPSHTVHIRDSELRRQVEERVAWREEIRAKKTISEIDAEDLLLLRGLQGFPNLATVRAALENGADPNRIVIIEDGGALPLWALLNVDVAYQVGDSTEADIRGLDALRILLEYGANPNWQISKHPLAEFFQRQIPKDDSWRLLLNLGRTRKCPPKLLISEQEFTDLLEAVQRKKPELLAEVAFKREKGFHLLGEMLPPEILREVLWIRGATHSLNSNGSHFLKRFISIDMLPPVSLNGWNRPFLKAEFERNVEERLSEILGMLHQFGGQMDRVINENCEEVSIDEWLQLEMARSLEHMGQLEREIFMQGLAHDCTAKPAATWDALMTPIGNGFTAPIDKLFNNLSDITAIWYSQALLTPPDIEDLKVPLEQERLKFVNLSVIKRFHQDLLERSEN